MPGIHAVLGADGAVGEQLIDVLSASGEQVRAVGRRPLPSRAAVAAGPPAGRAAVERVVADVATAAGARQAVAGASVVYACVQPAYTRWVQEFPDLISTVADATAAAGARLVLLDNLYGYGRVRGPITEDLPQSARTRKGQVRAAIAADLLRRHARGDLAVSIGRASDFIGPRGASLPNILVLQPVARGRKGRWVGRLDQAHSLNYTPDVARFLAVLGRHDEAFGRAWHLPASGSPTGAEFVTLAHRVAGIEARPGLVTPLMNRLGGLFRADVREGNELMYEFTEPFVLDDSAFRAAFGDHRPTPLDDAVRQILTFA